MVDLLKLLTGFVLSAGVVYAAVKTNAIIVGAVVFLAIFLYLLWSLRDYLR
jgi:hypothetical protein